VARNTREYITIPYGTRRSAFPSPIPVVRNNHFGNTAFKTLIPGPTGNTRLEFPKYVYRCIARVYVPLCVCARRLTWRRYSLWGRGGKLIKRNSPGSAVVRTYRYTIPSDIKGNINILTGDAYVILVNRDTRSWAMDRGGEGEEEQNRPLTGPLFKRIVFGRVPNTMGRRVFRTYWIRGIRLSAERCCASKIRSGLRKIVWNVGLLYNLGNRRNESLNPGRSLFRR